LLLLSQSLCEFYVTHTPKCNESAKLGQIINCGLTILIVSVFPVLLTNYDTAQICRCYQNGRYFYKTHLATVHMSTIRTYTGNLEKIWGGQTGRQAKIWECMAHPCPPLESLLPLSSSECVIVYVHCYRIKYDFILFKKMTALHLPTASLGYASKISCIASGRWYAVPGSERQLKRCMKISIKIATSSNS